MSVNIGDKCKDRLTNYEGIVVGRTEWMTGCATVGLQMAVKEDGSLDEAKWFDETRLVVLEKAVLVIEDGDQETKPRRVLVGGPQDTPKKPSGAF